MGVTRSQSYYPASFGGVLKSSNSEYIFSLFILSGLFKVNVELIEIDIFPEFLIDLSHGEELIYCRFTWSETSLVFV